MTTPQISHEPLMTGEELACRPDLHCELVGGRPVPMAFATMEQGILVVELGAILGSYAEKAGSGAVYIGNVGIYTRRDPDTVRGADVVFISRERLAHCGPTTFLDVAPDLVVEILAKDDSVGEVEQKIQEYLAAGVCRVWVIETRNHQLLVFRPDSEPETLGIGDTLRDEEILPGFSLPLSDLFQD